MNKSSKSALNSAFIDAAFIESAYIAFGGQKRIAKGPLLEVALKVKKHLEEFKSSTCVIFDCDTGQTVEFDLRGSPEDIHQRLTPQPKGPGRPKLGVISKEVTLLPRHWEWLATQPGGASVTLRKLVEDYKKTNQARDRVRLAQESTHRFMTVMAGDLPHFEEALRSLYAKNLRAFRKSISKWPKDIREHVIELSKRLRV